MNTSDIIVSVLFIAAIVGPIVYLIHRSKSLPIQLLTALKDRAFELNLSLSEQETWNNRAMGYDAIKKVLLFTIKKGESYLHYDFDLKDVSEVELITNKKLAVIEMRWTQPLKIDRIVLYDIHEDEPLDLGFHIALAKRWIKLLDTKKTQRFTPPKAA
ncbi:hypothetical protein E1176_05390 [Fulvivirga sp. RKSG066]|uniref:hypothetical protein n=1 Tax=Fulvivirga aurantia TaxID=2529383 RepID=UPI0012BD016E|nr:hypothetical protein [Fulvivirga aurantia]MTI20450.1 hypothetical protein [Fulvivirga aurantia]